jgi:catalase
VTGYFESDGQVARYSVAQVFQLGRRTPVVGRFAMPGGNPYAPDSSTPIRSMALRFTQADGQQWRTAMNSSPVFVVSTPQAFYQLLQAQQPDPATGKPDPRTLAAFFAAHPETAEFRAWAKATPPSASWATQSYYSLDAFIFVGPDGERHAVRWRMVPQTAPGASAAETAPHSPNDLALDLRKRLSQGPLRWRLWVTFAAPGDPIDDAAEEWPADRPTLNAGTLVIERTEPQASGPCRDVNYDPLVLPHGIAGSGDPLLAARSAVYAVSYLRRTSEEAHLPGYARPQLKVNPEPRS